MKSNNNNPAFDNSLACLQHPMTLLSIAVLLLNDHVLKVIVPSWLTGKLSDFAGLFFFPFIVAAGLSIALTKFNLSRERIGQIAFGIVAIWFTLLKTSPLVNSLTAQFASLFIGAPTRLIMDWTDLVALVSMWPAWRFWQGQMEISISRRAYVSLALGALACMATSPKMADEQFDTVTALSYSDSQRLLYAYGEGSSQIAQTSDFGDHWFVLESLESIRRVNLSNVRQPQSHICDTVMRSVCYKIAGSSQILVSNDGGTTWQVSWEIPPTRLEYLERLLDRVEIHDLLIANSVSGRFLFAAAGSYGILRRQLPDGDWTPIAVEGAQPFPFFASDFPSAVNVTGREYMKWVVIAFLALLINHILIWARFSVDRKIRELLSWLYFTFNLAMVVIIVELLLIFMLAVVLEMFSVETSWLQLNSGNPDSLLVIALTTLILFAWLLLRTDAWVAKFIPERRIRQQVLFYCALTLIGVFLLGYSPWLLWAFGVIQRYQFALNISIGVSVLVTVFGYYSIRTLK